MTERLNHTLQESLISLLAHSHDHGKIISSILDPNLFEGDYRLIAERAIDYWHKHQMPPGQHMSDLVSDILDDPGNRKAPTFRRILLSMQQLAPTINSTYVVGQVKTFMRMQRMKDAILKSAERLSSQQEQAIPLVEEIWNDLLRIREIDFEPGMRLHDIERLIAFMESHYAEFTSGIETLDKRHFAPYRDAVLLLLGAAGKGKTWGLVHIAKQALKLRKRVLHVSFEMAEEEVAGRYMQSLFSVPKREIKDLKMTTMERGEDEKELVGFEEQEVTPEFNLSGRYVREELETRITMFNRIIENLLIKRFPPRSLSMDGLRAYLDQIEITEKFIPDMLVLDYIGIAKTDPKNPRIGLGRQFEEFRGICIERHMAGVTAQQISKAGANAHMAGSTHVAEDWSLIGTADQVLVYSCTDAEAAHGLARLFVAKARSERDRYTSLITQNYDVGQFALESIILKANYWDLLKDLTGDVPEKEEEEEEEADE